MGEQMRGDLTKMNILDIEKFNIILNALQMMIEIRLYTLIL